MRELFEFSLMSVEEMAILSIAVENESIRIVQQGGIFWPFLLNDRRAYLWHLIDSLCQEVTSCGMGVFTKAVALGSCQKKDSSLPPRFGLRPGMVRTGGHPLSERLYIRHAHGGDAEQKLRSI